MDIKIVRIEAEGLRCPDVTMDFRENNEVCEVVLIQMPNGTGKTTTLEMLMATLTGTAETWSPAKVRSMGRPGAAPDRGRFAVELHVDEIPVNFECTLDYTEGTANYRTSTPSTGGVHPRWDPPFGLARFLTPEFMRLVLFDGEFADRLLQQSQSEAERAIDSVCELYLVDEMVTYAQQEWERYVEKKGTARTSRGLTQSQNKRDRLNVQLDKLRKAQKRAEERLGEIEREIAQLDENINQRMESQQGLRAKYEEAWNRKSDADSELQRLQRDLMHKIRVPSNLHHAFGVALTELKKHLDQLRLPEETTQQFFVELAASEHCVCGRPLDEESRAAIRRNAAEYMAEEQAGVINALKKDVNRFCENEGNEVDDVARIRAELESWADEVQSAESALRSLKDQLIEGGDDELRKWEQQRAELANEYNSKQEQYDELTRDPAEGDDPNTTFCIKSVERKRDELDNYIAQMTDTLEWRQKTDTLQDILREAKESARETIKERVREETNSSLAAILANDPVYIDRIEGALRMQSQEGASVGQTLAVGYAFLLNLLNRGSNRVPLVVDSPCGALDDGRRERIGTLIPALGSQFITFVIPTERAHFVEALEGAAAGKIKYLTVYRNTESRVTQFPDPPKASTESNDSGTLVDERDYFYKFTA